MIYKFGVFEENQEFFITELTKKMSCWFFLAKIEKVKNEDSDIFEATHKKLQIINNEGKPLLDARYGINGILVNAGAKSIDDVKKTIYFWTT